MLIYTENICLSAMSNFYTSYKAFKSNGTLLPLPALYFFGPP